MEDESNNTKRGWSCPVCTLQNSKESNICQACDNIIPVEERGVSTKPRGSRILGLFDDVKAMATKYVLNNNNNKKLTNEIEQPKSSSHTSLNKPRNTFEPLDHLQQKDRISNSRVDYTSDDCVPTNSKGGIATNPSKTHVRDDNDVAFTQPKFTRQKSKQTLVVRRTHEEEALERWKDIVEFCKQMKMQFVDDSFPPSPKSLTFNGSQVASVKGWLRPLEISILTKHKVKWEMFRNPRPSDIIQGVIGNCWFLSALAVVCEKPALLEQILITKELCLQGAYQVRICKNGKWTIVLVDDTLPCNGYGVPVYSQAARNQLWVPLIEKAVAKSVGCYEALVAGRCIEALQMLTGMPCESIVLQNKPGDIPEDKIDVDLIWVKILTCRDAGYLMGASCGGDIVDEDLINHYHDMGLEAQHAYSVLDVQQINKHRLIQLRNPWGRYSWTGAWSDDSPQWTDELRARLRPHGSVEGVFWISLEDMINYFDCIDICKYKPEWTEVTLEGNFASPLLDGGRVCHLTVFAPTELDITLFQESNRGSMHESIANLDLLIGIYQAQAGSDQPKPVSFITQSYRKIKPSVLCNVFLDPGIYLIIPFAFNHWNSGVQYDSPPKYVLSIHSSLPVVTDHISMPRYTYADALFMMVQKKGKKHEGIAGVTCYYMSYHFAGLIVAAENHRADVHLNVDCDCTNSFNVVSTRGALVTHDCLPPLQRQILTVLTQLEGAEGYAVTHKLRFRISPMNGFGSFGSHQDPLLVNGLGELHNPRPL